MIPNLRSPRALVGGLVYFGRMLDKVRIHAEGRLPEDYHANLGSGFDGRCADFLGVPYEAIVERTKMGGGDEEILAWCYQKGVRPSDEQVEVWNDFCRKRGWKDSASSILAARKVSLGLEDRQEIETFFDLIEADESELGTCESPVNG